MKKRILGIVIVFLIAFFLNFGEAQAIGIIDLNSTVNPDYNDSFSGLGDTTGTAYYKLKIEFTSAYGADYLQLVFEGDIFASVSNLTVISAPMGWALNIESSGPDLLLTANGIGAGDILDPGELIRLTVDYTLTDTYAYSFGTDPNNDPPLWSWSQDGPRPWEQSVTAILTSSTPPFIQAMGANSTIPEPSTLILLGFGLLGIGYLRRRCRKS